MDGLIAHYKMNDNLATDVILDATGNHHGAVKDAGGTATSAFHSLTGKINLAQDFDGNDDYIEIADHNDFTPALTPFSISVELYNHGNFEIVSKGTAGGLNREWRFYTSGFANMSLTDNNTGGMIGRIGGTSVLSYRNQWAHLVATYNGGVLSSGVKIYLNGVREDDSDNESGSFVTLINSAAPVHIGRYSTNYGDGLLDNVMFYSKELTSDEVKILHNARSGTEILAELDQQVTPRRGNLSPLPLRRRYEFA